jgi:zinc transporter, ZIP family
VTWIALPFAALTVVSTFAGGMLAFRLARTLPAAIALTGGMVVAIALFDILPEAIEAAGDARRVASLAGAGFLAFFLVERTLVLHHRDDVDQARAHHRVGVLGAAGLSAHSFVDGLGIGLAFGLDTATGLLVFTAIVAHDFADGLNTVNFVLKQSGDRRAARRWLAVDALAPLAGAVVGGVLSVSDEVLGSALGVYAGMFLYIGATDLLPEAHSHPSAKRVSLTVLGFAAMYGVSTLAAH